MGPICFVCERPGFFSCFSLSVSPVPKPLRRHVHICPECVRAENLGEPIGTNARTCYQFQK